MLVASGAFVYSTLRPPPEAEGPMESTPVEPDSSEATVFDIVQEESEARFKIGEILNGQPKTVVGRTNQVAGQLALEPDDPSTLTIGPVQVSARSLTTDNSFRNRAIKNRILVTDEYEFITFVPTAVTGLPAQLEAGQSFRVEIVGELTVRDVTHEVSFDATLVLESPTELRGAARSTILYRDFGISIPEVPAVAGVEDEVLLEFDFVARSS